MHSKIMLLYSSKLAMWYKTLFNIRLTNYCRVFTKIASAVEFSQQQCKSLAS